MIKRKTKGETSRGTSRKRRKTGSGNQGLSVKDWRGGPQGRGSRQTLPGGKEGADTQAKESSGSTESEGQ